MKNINKSLYIKLNELVESELKKDKPDTELINECVDGMLRLMPESAYQITMKQREENIYRIFEMLPNRKANTRIIRALIAAAIIMILLIGTVFAYTVVEYKIHDYGTYSEVWANIIPRQIDKPVEAGYIPEGFELVEFNDNKYLSSKFYKNDNEFMVVSKSNYKSIDINTEYVTSKTYSVSGIDYIFYGENEHGKGVVWFYNNYKYSIESNLSNEELLRIAQSIS